jgi:sterol desaturase/sphingolipid hydroxylase (fatty acid hydroxylase superfamily)
MTSHRGGSQSPSAKNARSAYSDGGRADRPTALHRAIRQTGWERLPNAASGKLARRAFDTMLSMSSLSRVRAWLRMDGQLRPGRGRLSGTIALALSVLCVLAVLAFHYPEYLSTPELRAKYSVAVLRQVLFASLVTAGALSLGNLLLGRSRWLSTYAFALVTLAVLAGGHKVPVNDFPDGTPYLGLDWFILDLLGSTLMFVAIEKLFPLYVGQPLFRKSWQTDLVHFLVNHLLVGAVLMIVNFSIHHFFGWAVLPGIGAFVRAQPFWLQLLGILLVADLVQYWTHRAYHEVPALWRFHAIHHSTEVLDWLAGSRMHMLELIVTRTAILGPIYVLGFSRSVMDAYVVIVGFQAVLNHANVSLPWGFLRQVIVTPEFHHWHHSSDRAAIDRNYAAHFSFLDALFGTKVKSDETFPESYGVVGDYVPEGFVRQQLYPFRRATQPSAEAAPKPE